MTVYIFGGSNTAMRLGWADSLAVRLLRRVPVQNLGLGATNSMNALVRLTCDVRLQPDDVVVWANGINDAICLSARQQGPQRQLIEAVEAMILHCRAAGARFVPVLFDSFVQHLMVVQADYTARILRLMAHYGLDVVNIPQAFSARTGLSHIPRHQFMDILHMVPQSEICEMVAELAAEMIGRGRGYPAQRPRLFLPQGTEFEVASTFVPSSRRAAFANSGLETTVWAPPVSIRPTVQPTQHSEIEAVTLLADSQQGRFSMHVGSQRVRLAANHNFANTGTPMALTVCIRQIEPAGIRVAPGDEIRIDWDNGTDPIPVDMYFQAVPASHAVGDSDARVLSVLMRHSDGEEGHEQGGQHRI